MRWKKRFRSAYYFAEDIPPLLRLALGVVLVLLGPLGFLPVLGFWMIPVGLLLIALNVPSLRRRVQQRLEIPEGKR
jgi:hypothetical protein